MGGPVGEELFGMVVSWRSLFCRGGALVGVTADAVRRGPPAGHRWAGAQFSPDLCPHMVGCAQIIECRRVLSWTYTYGYYALVRLGLCGWGVGWGGEAGKMERRGQERGGCQDE